MTATQRNSIVWHSLFRFTLTLTHFAQLQQLYVGVSNALNYSGRNNFPAAADAA